MTFFKGLLQCEGAPVAKTQIIDVQGVLKDNVCRLLCHGDHGMSVVYGFRDGKKERLGGGKKESAEAYAKRMHGEIKEIIRNKLGLNKGDCVTYETARVYTEGRVGERWFFSIWQKLLLIPLYLFKVWSVTACRFNVCSSRSCHCTLNVSS